MIAPAATEINLDDGSYFLSGVDCQTKFLAGN
jgi:hypothetical protein